MKQIVFSCDDLRDESRLGEILGQLRGERQFLSGYVQVLSELLDKELIFNIRNTMKRLMPELPFFAVTTAANIVDSDQSDPVTIVVNIFEYESTRAELIQYAMGAESVTTAKQIVDYANTNSWVKGIEIYYSNTGPSATAFCDYFDGLRPGIEITGGVICSPEFSPLHSIMYYDDFSENGVIALFLGGSELHLLTTKISGWRAIGRIFQVTGVSGNILREIDGQPAYEIYRKYLDIANDENLFENTLEFPLIYLHNGSAIARCPMAGYDDGSLLLPADIKEGSAVRLSYGDTRTIMRAVTVRSDDIKDFCPDVVHIVSCAARREFWSEKTPTFELQPFKGLKMTGFFSHGEFAREKGHLNQHNTTLVLSSLREGPPDLSRKVGHDPRLLPTRLPLAYRMATFIREMTFELDQKNDRLEAMNVQLKEVAKTDPLTGLGNRLSFDELLNEIASEKNNDYNWLMVMIDINGLKYTNDNFGHSAGDKLITTCAEILQKIYSRECCFRIGGDEFVVMMPATLDIAEALRIKLDDEIREYNRTGIYPLSVAYGMSSLRDDDGQRKHISDWKLEADLRMYRDKSGGQPQFGFGPHEKYKEFISCLISVEEAKDPYTAHHSERVRAIAELIAKKMGLSERTIQLITDAAHLHDIGKVGISDAILGKPGRLTEEEYAVIKEHPVIGARILRKSNHMQEIVQIVMHHHERYDGKGYPEGLAGEEIPLGGRVIAIADSIDAITSKRVYRDAMSLNYCRDEVEHNIGIMYDPAIARLTLECWDDIVKILLDNLDK